MVGDGGKSIIDGLFDYNAATPLPPAPPVTKQDDNIKEPSQVNTLDYVLQFQANKIFFWGIDNTYPNALDAEARQCNVLEAGLKVYADILKGQGTYLYKWVFKDGQRVQEQVDDPEMYDWLYAIQYEKYYNKACQELPRWGQIIPVYRFNEKKQLAQMHIYDTFWGRLEKPDPNTANIENVYLSGQWWRGVQWSIIASGDIPDQFKPWITKLPLLKPFDEAGQMLASDIKEWAQWIGYDTSGSTYARAPWHACYENRAIAMSASAYKMEMRVFEAAITINYMIGIHEDYWRSKYTDWDSNPKWTKDAKEQAVKDFQKSIEDSLVGKEQSFKSLFYSIWSKKDGNLVESLKLTVVDNGMRENTQFVPKVQTANGDILSSLTLPQSVLGLVQQGGTNSAGSGSPVREDGLSLNARLKPDRDIIDRAYYVARDYTWSNGEKKDIHIGHMDYVINTLDGRAANTGAVAIPK